MKIRGYFVLWHNRLFAVEAFCLLWKVKERTG